jgi:hypothetical protein
MPRHSSKSLAKTFKSTSHESVALRSRIHARLSGVLNRLNSVFSNPPPVTNPPIKYLKAYWHKIRAGYRRVGRVVSVGARVGHVKEGDRTLVPFLHPSWAERIKTDAPWLRLLPQVDINQFAMMGVNPPSAYLLLNDIVKLARGSWVIQNGANSGVGRAINPAREASAQIDDPTLDDSCNPPITITLPWTAPSFKAVKGICRAQSRR